MLIDLAVVVVSGALTGATYTATYHNDPPHKWPHRRLFHACRKTVQTVWFGTAYVVVTSRCFVAGRLSVALFHVKHGAYWVAWQLAPRARRAEVEQDE